MLGRKVGLVRYWKGEPSRLVFGDRWGGLGSIFCGGGRGIRERRGRGRGPRREWGGVGSGLLWRGGRRILGCWRGEGVAMVVLRVHPWEGVELSRMEE